MVVTTTLSEQPMPETTDMGQPSSPLSWRDVYRAVSESEIRIVAAINTAVGPLNTSVVDHEARIRDLERNGPDGLQVLQRKVDAICAKVELLEREEATLVAREKGILSTFSAGQKVILLLASIIGIVYTIVHLIGDFTRVAT